MYKYELFVRRSKDCGTKYDITGSVAVPARSRETAISITGRDSSGHLSGESTGQGLNGWSSIYSFLRSEYLK